MQNQIFQSQIEVLEAIKSLLTDFPEVDPIKYITGVENKLKECINDRD